MRKRVIALFVGSIWAVGLTAVLGYLLGSVSGAITASKLFHKTDIRKYGSGNAGMTNALRTFGTKTAVWVSLMDALKTLAALAAGRWLAGGDAGLIAAAAGVLLGHAFPLYHHFKGGKCVLSGGVILLWIDWRVFLVAVAVFLLLALATKIVAVGSLGACLSAPVSVLIFLPGRHGLLAFVCLMALFIIILHHSNIRRLIEKRELKATPGTEDKHGR